MTRKGSARISFSCVEGPEPPRGEANINADPLFCGWPSAAVRITDQEELEEALGEFDYGLSANSPCLGAGEEGADI